MNFDIQLTFLIINNKAQYPILNTQYSIPNTLYLNKT